MRSQPGVNGTKLSENVKRLSCYNLDYDLCKNVFRYFKDIGSFMKCNCTISKLNMIVFMTFNSIVSIHEILLLLFTGSLLDGSKNEKLSTRFKASFHDLKVTELKETTNMNNFVS